MTRRRGRKSPFSLFAFQDIITSVMGIVVLLSLLMALLMIRAPRQPEPEGPASRADPEALRNEIADLQRRVQQASSANAALRQYLDFIAGREPKQLDEQVAQARAATDALQQQVEALQARHQAARQEVRRQTQRREQAAREQQQELARLRQQAAALADELARLRSEQRVFYNPADLQGRQTWLVELSAQRILAAPAGRRGPAIVFQAASSQATFRMLRAWLKANRAGNHFLFLIKPSAAEEFRELHEFVQDGNYHYGYDLLGETETAVDEQNGAAA